MIKDIGNFKQNAKGLKLKGPLVANPKSQGDVSLC